MAEQKREEMASRERSYQRQERQHGRNEATQGRNRTQSRN